jgi:hypothetical protein
MAFPTTSAVGVNDHHAGIDIIHWLTSGTGVFAAIAAVIALLVGVYTLVGPVLSRRQAQKDAAGSLRLSAVDLGPVSRSSRSCELRFKVTNAGTSPCVLTGIRLHMNACDRSDRACQFKVEAPITVHKHRIELEPAISDYDIRSRKFAPALPPLSLARGETEAFLVKLVSHEPYWYEFVIIIDWFDTLNPDLLNSQTSESIRVEFPQSKPSRFK